MVSVIIPLYNREGLVLETINSVKSQTYQEWEIIIVDDGSTDRGPEIVEELASGDERIQFIKRQGEQKGASVCRNIGIRASKGDYLIFLDSDDILAPWCIEQRMSSINENNEYDCVIAPGCFFEESPLDATFLWNKLVVSDCSDLVRFLNGDPVWQTAGVIWRKNYLLNNQLSFFEDAKSSQDWEFHLHALLNNGKTLKLDNIPDYFVRRDKRIERISGRHFNLDMIENRLMLYPKVFNYDIILLKKKEYRTKIHRLFFKDIYYAYLNNISIDLKHYTNFRNFILSNDISSLFAYYNLKFGNGMIQSFPRLFKIYRKVFDLCFFDNYFNVNSYYRFPMNQNEINALHDKLNQYSYGQAVS